jgi:hypothetical protein
MWGSRPQAGRTNKKERINRSSLSGLIWSGFSNGLYNRHPRTHHHENRRRYRREILQKNLFRP